MNCVEARESFPALLDGDIGLTERAPLEAHLRHCGGCRQALDRLHVSLQQPESPRPGFVRRTLEAVRPAARFSKMGRLMVLHIPTRHLAVTAAMLAALLTVFLFHQGSQLRSAMLRWTSLTPAPVAVERPQRPTPTAAAPTEVVARPEPASVIVPPRTAPPQVAPAPPPAVRPRDDVSALGIRPASSPPRDARADGSAKPPAGKSGQPQAAKLKSGGTEVAGKALAAAGPGGAAPKPAESASSPVAFTRTQGPVDVIGRLAVKSRADAERNLSSLLARAGGTTVSRQRGAKVTVIETVVPQSSYGRFIEGLGRIGAWQIEAGRTPLPDRVRVTVRLAD